MRRKIFRWIGISLAFALLPWYTVLAQEGGVASLQELNAMIRALPKFSGDAAAAFGQYADTVTEGSITAQTDSSYTVIDVNLVLTAKKETLDYYLGYRLFGSQGGSSARGGGNNTGTFSTGQIHSGQVRVRWSPSQIFSVSIGRLPGINNTGFAGVHPAEGLVSPAGYDQYTLFDQGAADFRFGGDRFGLGFAFSSACQPACNTSATGSSFAIQSQGSTLVYVSYAHPSFGFGFRTQSASGRGRGRETGSDLSGSLIDHVADPKLETEASAVVAEFYVKAGWFYLGVESTSADLSKVSQATLSEQIDSKIATKDDTAVGLRFGNQSALYIFSVNEETIYPADSTNKPTLTVASLIAGYEKKEETGSWGIEYAMQESKTTSEGKKTEIQSYGFFVKSGF